MRLTHTLSIILLNSIFLSSPLTLNAEVIKSDKLLVKVSKQLTHINTQQLEKRIESDKNMVLIDVRTAKEIDQLGTINAPQNIPIPRGWLEFRIDEYANENTPIVVYCGLNLRSQLAAKSLMDMGYKNVVNYQNSFIDWQKQGLPIQKTDKAPLSALYSLPQKVVDGVWSAIGATTPGNYENGGHNNNLSFVIGDEAVLVFNAGGSYALAKAMHEEIKKITQKPVKYVALENAQGHAMLGSNYWQEQGVQIIGHHLIIDEINHNKTSVFERNTRVLKDRFNKTKIITPNKIFEDKLGLDLGNLKIELLHLGASHSPEDIQLWIPTKKLLITGDTAFNTRMLPILGHTDTAGWLETWDRLVALNADVIIPGHGGPTDLETITHFTKDYLTYMRKQVDEILANDGDLADAYKIDQTAFRGWDTYHQLHLQNASRLYQQMEFE